MLSMLSDNMNGPMWLLWVVVGLFAFLTILLLSGRGGALIAGYNDMKKAEKAKYDEKKLCRVVGGCMGVITLLISVMAIWEDVLPESFAVVSLVVIFADVVVTIILCNTICKKKE